MLWIIRAKIRDKKKFFSNESELNYAFAQAKTSCMILVIVIEAAKNFGNSKFLKDVEQRFCVVPEDMAENFVKKMKNLQESFTTYE